MKNGYGKRTHISEFSTKGRGGKGMIAIQASDRNGLHFVGATQLFDGDEIMLIDRELWSVLAEMKSRIVGRNTQGVRVIRLKENEKL